MSRKVSLSVPVEVVVRDRDAKLLALVARMSMQPESGVTVSHADLAAELGASADALRRAVASCREAGWILVTENCLSNGGRLANTYVLTEEGAALAKAALDAGLAA